MRNLKESRWLIFSVTSMANLVASFSINSLNLALPTIAREFGVRQSNVSWLTLVYSLIPCCMLLLFGRTAEIYGYKRQMKMGFLVFGLVCLCVPFAARTLGLFIFLRALQGMGYSILISITQAIVSRTFPPSERGRALGVNSVFVSAGLAAGATLGGFLISAFSWHAIFYVNIPFCVLGWIASAVVLPEDGSQQGRAVMDWLGAVFFAGFTGCLAVGLNFIDDWGWRSPQFLAFMAASAFCVLLFVQREKRARQPMMPLHLFRSRVFTLANLSSGLSYLAQQMNVYLIPFFLVDVLLLNSAQAGWVVLITPVMMLIVSPISGIFVDRHGSKRPALFGLMFILAGCLCMCLLQEEIGLLWVIASLSLTGFGVGCSVGALNTAILTAVPGSRSGVASGMLATMRNLGQTLGVACGSVLLTVRQTYYDGTELDFSGAYIAAQRDVYYFAIAVVVLTIVLVFLLPDRAVQQEQDI